MDAAVTTKLVSEIVAAVGTKNTIAIYLFGSAAMDEMRPDSDIDLAVLLRDKMDPVARWKLQGALANIAHRHVDVVDLREASTVMRVQVLRDARVLYDGDLTKRELFEATALGAYARFQERRKGLLDDIRARGSIYG